MFNCDDWPDSRTVVTPDKRPNESAIDGSGKTPKSPAPIKSPTTSELRLASIALSTLKRTPLTEIISICSFSGAASSAAKDELVAIALAESKAKVNLFFLKFTIIISPDYVFVIS